MKIAIIGAGKLGTTLATLSVAAGFETVIYSRPKPMLDLILSTLVPQAQLVEFEEAVKADIIVLAVPRTALATLNFSTAAGLIIDATNPWEATGTTKTPSQLALSTRAPVVRTLNHISYEELANDSRVLQEGPRRAVAVVDSGSGVQEVAAFVAAIGFDPVIIPADTAPAFEPNGELFGAWLSADEMKSLL